MKTLLKVIFTGMVAALIKILGQILILKTIIQPSGFVENGTLPILFVLYNVTAYCTIAALFLLLKDNLSGHPILNGLKYGLSCCVIWGVYLLEPLPHFILIDKITYHLADLAALIIMGLLLGLLSTKSSPEKERKKSNSWRNTLCITACFINGRIILYFAFNVYSSFNTENLVTVLWTIFTGYIIATVVNWYSAQMNEKNLFKKAFCLGGLLFGFNLLVFNFFISLVLNTDVFDLTIRTVIDSCSVIIGLLLPLPIKSRNKYFLYGGKIA